MEWEYERVYPDLDLIPYNPMEYAASTTSLEGEVYITNRTTLIANLLRG